VVPAFHLPSSVIQLKMNLPGVSSLVAAWWNSFRTTLASPVDGASLALFRVTFGLIMLWEAMRYLSGADGSKIQTLFTDPTWHFSYPGFSWIRAWPEPGMQGCTSASVVRSSS